MRRAGIILLLAGLAAVYGAPAADPPFTVFRTDDPTLGVNPPPKELNEWKGGWLSAAHRPPSEAYAVLEELDFFRQEFGSPVEPFAFTVGDVPWRRTWGTEGKEHDKPAARFGRGWDKLVGWNFCLEMDLEQETDETEWELVYHCRFGYRSMETTPFTVKGRGRVNYRLPLGPIKLDAHHWVNGVALVCKTKGAAVRVSRLVIAPFSCEVSWRRRFMLTDEVFRGGVSYSGKNDFTLVVNGKTVRRGVGYASVDVCRDDITQFLRRGENEIVYTGNFNTGAGPSYRFLINAFAVAPDGKTTVIPADGKWEWRFANGDWTAVRPFGTAGLTAQPNGNLYTSGNQPLHPGPLDPKPRGTSRYPIFGEDETIAWQVDLPPGLANPILQTEVREALTQELKTNGFKGLKTGAYHVTWILKSGDREIDRVTREMVVVGRLDLPEVPLKEVQSETVRRQRLVSKIDCTVHEANPSNFIDHSNWFGSKICQNVGRVTERPTGRYRETGPNKGDLFSYRIEVGEMGRPHILEFDYPDDADRMIYCAVMDSIALGFRNNTPPEGYQSWASGTCGIRCGGFMPLSGEKRTGRLLFFPASKVNTVYFENGVTGSRAAVSEVRVYALDGDLPVPPPPKTTRLYGNHNERPLMHHWGSFVTPAIHAYDRGDQLLKWTAAYWSVANRIRQMRHCGQNCSIEGGYMYDRGFPSKSGVSECIAEDFDYHELILKMYKANGIRVFLSYEYTGSPDVSMSGARSVGDRENWAGTARPADQVDRFGRQITGHGMAVNAFSPAVWPSALKAMREMYERYAPIGAVEGVVIQVGWLWAPSFGWIKNDVTAMEVGYDDDTVEAFERDTGLRLGLPWKGGERFAKRYKLLTGRYRTDWESWRRRSLVKKTLELADQCRGLHGNWKLWSSPCTGVETTPGDYAGTNVRVLEKITYGKELQLDDYLKGFTRTARAARTSSEWLYFACVLNEHLYTQVNRATGWWWKTTRCVVFDTKPSGPNAMYDLSLVVADHAPQTFFHTWLDMNIPTGSPDAERAAAYRFYALPDGEQAPLDTFRGVTAKRVGKRVALVNETPYELAGELAVNGRGVTLKLSPFEIRTLPERIPFEMAKGTFELDAKGTEIVRVQDGYLEISTVREKLSAEYLGLLGRAAMPYDRARLLRDPEMLSSVRAAFGDEGVSRYVNGEEPLRYVSEGEPVFAWQAGVTNASTWAVLPEGSLRKEDSVRFFRLLPDKDHRTFLLRPQPNDVALPNGVRTFEARARVHGTNAWLQIFGPWKSRYDLMVKDGRVQPAAILWPSDNNFHVIKPDAAHLLPLDTWFDLAIRVDPEGEATLFVDGFLQAHLDLARLHGDKIPDEKPRYYGSFNAKEDPAAYVDFQYLRLLRSGEPESIR